MRGASDSIRAARGRRGRCAPSPGHGASPAHRGVRPGNSAISRRGGRQRTKALDARRHLRRRDWFHPKFVADRPYPCTAGCRMARGFLLHANGSIFTANSGGISPRSSRGPSRLCNDVGRWNDRDDVTRRENPASPGAARLSQPGPCHEPRFASRTARELHADPGGYDC